MSDAGYRIDEEPTCLSTLPCETARIRFKGTFQGRATIWDMQLQTLAHWREGLSNDADEISHADGICGIIDVGEEHGGTRALVVALEVPVIDMPTVRKALIMVRNYRRLRPGRHTWGEAGSGAD